MLFFEARKKKDLYVWLAKAPEGPSVKFYVTNGVSLGSKHAYLQCLGRARPWFKLPERTCHGTGCCARC